MVSLLGSCFSPWIQQEAGPAECSQHPGAEGAACDCHAGLMEAGEKQAHGRGRSILFGASQL